MVKTTSGRASVFDYPQYFEWAFQDETVREADFLEAAFRKYGRRPTRTLVEPGCGGGRLLVALARRGYSVAGCDTSAPALAYLRRRLRRNRLEACVWQADMADMQPPSRYDAAVSTFDTFRHLLDEESALNHLRSIAQCLLPGGIYVLGFHLLPLDVSPECTERWFAMRGQTRAHFTLRVLATDRRRRLERIRISLLVRRQRSQLRVQTEFPYRMYTAGQFRRLLRRVPALQLCDVYDFWYDIEEPLMLDDQITDTVFILRRR